MAEAAGLLRIVCPLPPRFLVVCVDYPQHPEKKRRIRLKKLERDGAAVAVVAVAVFSTIALPELVVVFVTSCRVFISSNSICSARKSLSSDSFSSLLKSMTANIIFVIIPFVFSVRKYDLISSDAL